MPLISHFPEFPFCIDQLVWAAMLLVSWSPLTTQCLNPKAMVHFQLFLRLVKSIALSMVLAGLIVAIVFTNLSVTDVFASILAFVPTGWGILSVSFLLPTSISMKVCVFSFFSLYRFTAKT